MESINVSDLPAPVARAIAEMVEAVRQQLARNPKQAARELRVWEGTILGSLTREEIYDDVT